MAEQYQFDVCFYPGPSVGVSGRAIRKLGQAVRSRAPDVIHVHGLQTEGFNCMMGAMLGSGAPRLLTVHGFIEDSKFRSPWRRQVIARVLEPVTLRCADGVVAVSRYGSEKPVLRRWSRDRPEVIGNAIPPLPRTEALVSEAIRRRCGWSTSDVVAICVARLSREKGLLDLAEAFAGLAPRRAAIRLLLVGDGPDAHLVRAQLQTWISRSRVMVHPATGNVAALLAAADLFVLPSLHEQQSLAILEAMTAGLPVVSTRVGGTPELVRHGETGFLVPPRQPALLAQTLEDLALDPTLRRRLGRAGMRAVELHHSFGHFIDRVEAVYERMLDCG